MSSDVISSEELAAVRQLGYNENVTYCKVFNWFRLKWGYVAWIEKTSDKYSYKIYNRGVYHRPKNVTEYPYCKTYEEAQVKLLEELIAVTQEQN
jgi:hypothetical protein